MKEDIPVLAAGTADKDFAVVEAIHQTDTVEVSERGSSFSWLLVQRIGLGVAGLIIWQLVAGNLISTFYLPQPLQVMQVLASWIADGSLYGNVVATLIPALKGFIIASVCAIVFGYLLAMARSASRVVEPYIAALYGIPIIALVPLMIVWFGIGEELAVGVAALSAFFLMFYNVYFGVRDVSQALIDQVLIAGGSRWDIAVRVRLPSALVWVLAGTKLAVPHSVVGVVVAEFLTGQQGLGFLLAYHANMFDSAGTFAAVTMLALITFSLDRLMFVLTRRALMWKDAGMHR